MTQSGLCWRAGARRTTRTAPAVVMLVPIAVAMLAVPRAGTAQMQAHAASQPASTSSRVLLVNDHWIGRLTQTTIVQTPGTPAARTQITVALGFPECQRFLPVVASTLAGRQPALTVQIEDFARTAAPTDLITLPGAYISQIQLPALAEDGKDPARVVVAFAPGTVEETTPSSAPAFPTTVAAVKAWLMSDFRFETNGLSLQGVVGVDRLVVDVAAPALHTITRRDVRPTTLTYHPLVVHVLGSAATPFRQWLASGAARNGSLTLYDHTMTHPVLRIALGGLRVRSIVDDAVYRQSGAPVSTVTLDVAHVTIAGGFRAVVAP